MKDGTVRQHDLRTQHRCSPNRESCSAVLVRVPFELSTISMSSLTSYHFVVAGESPYVCLTYIVCSLPNFIIEKAFLFDRRQVGRRIEEEWGVNLTSSEITTCVRRFGRRHTQLPPKSLYQDHITGSRLSQANGHEVQLSLFSSRPIISFSSSSYSYVRFSIDGSNVHVLQFQVGMQLIAETLFTHSQHVMFPVKPLQV